MAATRASALRGTLLIAMLLVGWARASAQRDSTRSWRYSVTPYAWTAGLDGRVGVGPVGVNVNLGFDKILDALNFAFMATGEARRGAWLLSADAIFVSLGHGGAIAFRGDTGRFELTEHETIIQPVGGYTLGDDVWSVDLVGGFRYWYLSTTLDTDPARRAAVSRAASRQWADATAGFRFRWIPGERFRVAIAGDGGGGGSQDSWQAAASLGYDGWRRWTLGAAYRWLWVNYDRRNFLFDTRMNGFVLAATYRIN